MEQVGDRQSGREIMTKVASQSIVLLKNEGGVLPLKPQASHCSLSLHGIGMRSYRIDVTSDRNKA